MGMASCPLLSGLLALVLPPGYQSNGKTKPLYPPAPGAIPAPTSYISPVCLLGKTVDSWFEEVTTVSGFILVTVTAEHAPQCGPKSEKRHLRRTPNTVSAEA